METLAPTTEGEANVRLPILLVEVLPGNDLLVASSPVATRLVALCSGKVVHTIRHAVSTSAPRRACATPIRDAASSSSTKSTAQWLLALVGDDKVLSVYRLSHDPASTQQASMECVLRHTLPKRVVKLLWESEKDADVKRLIIGDRHGDVRSVVIDAKRPAINTESSSMNGSKDDNDHSVKDKAKAPTMDDEEDDELGTLHVGHVSLLTDFVLSSFSTNERQKPDSYIITSDRDEHIRISRWGERRAGYIALRYLLGSSEAIGSLCTIERETLQALRSEVKSSGTPCHEDWLSHPVLISTDGSTLRLWSLCPDSEHDSRTECLATFDLTSFVQKYVCVDMYRERRREKIYGKGKIDMKKTMANLPSLNDAQGRSPEYIPIITKTWILEREAGCFLIFQLDGARALFSLPLASLFQEKPEPGEHINAFDVGSPITHSAPFTNDKTGEHKIFVACEVRDDFVQEARRTPNSLQCIRWNDEKNCFDLQTEALPKCVSELDDLGSPALAAATLVYDALTLYPKQEFEATATLESTSTDGLIRGGLANHEIPGRPASSANRDNSEHVTRRRETAREAMKRRIEESVVQPPQQKKQKRQNRRQKAKKVEDGVQPSAQPESVVGEQKP